MYVMCFVCMLCMICASAMRAVYVRFVSMQVCYVGMLCLCVCFVRMLCMYGTRGRTYIIVWRVRPFKAMCCYV